MVDTFYPIITSQTIIIPNLTNPSAYHEAKVPTKNKAVDLDIAVLCWSHMARCIPPNDLALLELALEIYYTKIRDMLLSSN